jgi:hypothetical protein
MGEIFGNSQNLYGFISKPGWRQSCDLNFRGKNLKSKRFIRKKQTVTDTRNEVKVALTKALWGHNHLLDLIVEIGVHDPGAGILAAEI